MTDIDVTNSEVLNALASLQHVTPDTALVAVKLARLRKALRTEAQPIIAAFDETGKRHARKDDAGAPVVKHDESGEPLAWLATGTPFYELADPEAFAAEAKALHAERIAISAPTLTEQDLAHMAVAGDVGDALLPFVVDPSP
jgi:hypothetical protein